jgi:sugar phosphate isomerase/epimerase
MTKPISIQLYTVREEMNADVWGALGRLAEIGFPGIEPCSVPGGDVVEAARRIADLGLTVSAYQGGTPVGDNKERLLDEAEALGTTHIVCPYHGQENFADMNGLKMTAELFNEAIANCAARGMTFGYHNHEFELESIVDGQPALLQLAALAPKLFFTVDTYWVTVGGQDAAEVVSTLGPQANLLHIKDGPLVKSAAMVAAGSGKMDFPPIVEAATAAKWLVVELDHCDTDMMTAVEQSFKYLVNAGLGRGK